MTLFKQNNGTLPALTPEVSFLIDLVSGKSIRNDSLLIFKSDIIKLARYHKLSYFLIQHSRNSPQSFTPGQNEMLSRMASRISSRALIQLHELGNISTLFREAGISFVVVKGPQLASMLYGKKALKESVDLDIMLGDKSCFDDASAVLTKAGFELISMKSNLPGMLKNVYIEAKREMAFMNREKRIFVDLHLKPSPNSYFSSARFRDFLKKKEVYALEGISVPILPPEKYLVFLCHHAALHQFSRLGWINDIRSFLTVVKPDISETIETARRTGTEISFFTAMFLINKLFAAEIPVMDLKKQERRNAEKLSCASVALLNRDSGFLMSFRGRLFRLRYLIKLNSNLTGKVDVFTGLFLRMLVKSFRQSPTLASLH